MRALVGITSLALTTALVAAAPPTLAVGPQGSTTSAGAAIAWGDEAYGWMTEPVPSDALKGITAISAGSSLSLALKGGRVIAWGADGYASSVPAEARSGVTAITAAFNEGLAIKDGRVLVWPDTDSYVNRLLPESALSGVTAIDASPGHVLALKGDRVIAWGYNAYGQSTVPADLQSGVSTISAGTHFSLAVKAGRVHAWGFDNFGLLAVPDTAQSGVTAISAGNAHALALKDGGVIAWGYNGSGEIDVPEAATSGVTAIAAGAGFSMALKGGEVIVWGSAWRSVARVPDLAKSGVTAIAAGPNHALALKVGDTTPGAPTINVYGTNYAGAPGVPSFNLVVLYPLAGLSEASLAVRREAEALVIADAQGDRSLTLQDGLGAVTCKGEEPAAPFSVVRCSFPQADSQTDWVVRGDFADAQGPISMTVDSGSAVRAVFTGSAHSDFFQGGMLDDYARGMASDDTLLGGVGSDVLYGEEGNDTLQGEAGTDTLGGGVGNDTLNGGGASDSVVGGLGWDNVKAKDGVRDNVDCGKPEARDPRDINTLVDHDSGMDVVVECGVVEIPTNASAPLIDGYDVRVGERIYANVGTWRGTAPMKYDYQWHACFWIESMTQSSECTRLRVGTLNAQGLETSGAEKGKRPSYVPVRKDVGRYLRFTVRASNGALKGGGVGSAEATMGTTVGAPPTLSLDGGVWLPAQRAGDWSFGLQKDLAALVRSSKISPYALLIEEAVPLNRFPRTMRNAIQLANRNGNVGQILDVTVNGKALSAGQQTLVEATLAEQATIKVRYYDPVADRSTCPVSDADIGTINRSIAAGSAYSLSAFSAVLKGLRNPNGGTCPWRVEWLESVSARPFLEVTNVRVETNPDSDEPARLVLQVRRPNVSAGLSLVVGPPQQEHIRDNPGHFNLHPSMRLVTFPNAAPTSLWIGLLGDQVRQGAKFARAEVFINGRLRSTTDFGIPAANGRIPYSLTLTETLREKGTMRIVVTTFAGEPKGLVVPVVGQVFADFDIVGEDELREDAEPFTLLGAATWDGRCFTFAGVQQSCDSTSGSWTYGRELRDMELAMLQTYKGKGLLEESMFDSAGTLRYASETLGRTFTVIVANSNIKETPPAPRSAAPRARDCYSLDLVCHLSNLGDAIGSAVMSIFASPQDRKPKVVRPRIRVKLMYIGPGKPGLAIYGGGVLNVGGHLINLDGGTLINLDGGSLAELMKAGLINLDGGTLLNLDGGTLIGLDANGLLSDMGSALSPRAGQIAIPLVSDAGVR